MAGQHTKWPGPYRKAHDFEKTARRADLIAGMPCGKVGSAKRVLASPAALYHGSPHRRQAPGALSLCGDVQAAPPSKAPEAARSIKFSTSLARHAVKRAPIWMGCGAMPFATRAHHVLCPNSCTGGTFLHAPQGIASNVIRFLVLAHEEPPT